MSGVLKPSFLRYWMDSYWLSFPLIIWKPQKLIPSGDPAAARTKPDAILWEKLGDLFGVKSSPLICIIPETGSLRGISWISAILFVTSIPFLEMDFSNLPSLYCKAIAMPSILGSINNRVLDKDPLKVLEYCLLEVMVMVELFY